MGPASRGPIHAGGGSIMAALFALSSGRDSKCRGVAMQGPDFKRLVQDKFDARTTYDEGDERHPKLAVDLVQRAQLQKGWRVLDLACGTGLVTYMASEIVGSTGSATGVDISPGMIRQVQLALSSFDNVPVRSSNNSNACRQKQSYTEASSETFRFKLVTLRSAILQRSPLTLYCVHQPFSMLI